MHKWIVSAYNQVEYPACAGRFLVGTSVFFLLGGIPMARGETTKRSATRKPAARSRAATSKSWGAAKGAGKTASARKPAARKPAVRLADTKRRSTRAS